MPLAGSRGPAALKVRVHSLLVSYRTLAKQKPAPRALRPDEASMRLWKPGKPVLAAAPALLLLAAWRFARPTRACKREVSCKALVVWHLVHARKDEEALQRANEAHPAPPQKEGLIASG